jgi:hypothetical protein
MAGVTAANRSAIQNFVRANNVPLPTSNGRVDVNSKQVQQLADDMGMSQGAVKEALSGFTPAQPQTTGGGWCPMGQKGTVGKQAFESVDTAGRNVDVHTYEALFDTFKDLSKDQQKAELKWVDSQGQYGLHDYLQERAGLLPWYKSLLDSAGSAIGEATDHR